MVSAVVLQVAADHIFLKHRMIPCNLREPVFKAPNDLAETLITLSVKSWSWATPNVTQLKSDRKTSRISDKHLTVNRSPKLHNCIPADSEDTE